MNLIFVVFSYLASDFTFCVSFLQLTYFVPCQSFSEYVILVWDHNYFSVSYIKVKLEMRWVEHKMVSQEFQVVFLIATVTLEKLLI